MQTSEHEFNTFSVTTLSRLIEFVSRNNLDETKEKFWFSIYELPRSEEVANRLNDGFVRQLVSYLEENQLISVHQTVEIDYRPSNIEATKANKIIDSIQVIVKSLEAIQKARDTLLPEHGTDDDTKAIYDKDKRELTIGGHVVKFRGKAEVPFMDTVCVSKSSMKKTWHNDELRFIKDPEPDVHNIAKNWGTMTADNINSKKLKPQTGISDFFIINEGSVKVNSRYLS